jgi:hypothetical protein
MIRKRPANYAFRVDAIHEKLAQLTGTRNASREDDVWRSAMVDAKRSAPLGSLSAARPPIPGQQLVDAIDRVIGDPAITSRR